jgi:hypothetical protein
MFNPEDSGLMKFAGERPYADPEAAARKLLDIVRALIEQSGISHTYTGVTNSAFLTAGGSPAEYTAGVKYAAAQKWFEVDRSGTRITLLPDGAE